MWAKPRLRHVRTGVGTCMVERTSVVMSAFDAVLQQLSGLGIYPDLVGYLPIPNVEGITQAAPTPFLLQFLRDDFACVGLKRGRARFIERDLGVFRIFLAGKRHHL